MDFHALEKMTVGNLRELLKEKDPERKGVSGLKKDELVEALAALLGIEKPHKVVEGADKASIKAAMRDLKKKREEALAAGDSGAAAAARSEARKLKKQLRRVIRKAA